jgi:hypothetical protein
MGRTAEVNWFEGKDGAARLAHDRALVGTEYPALEYDVPADGPVTLAGTIDVVLPSGTTHTIPTRIAFPRDYPAHEPWAYQDSKVFVRDGDRHFYADGRICLWLDLETRWRAEDPDALLMFLDQVRHFYARQIFMDARPGAPYPGPARPHGLDAYLPHLARRFAMAVADLPRMWRAVGGGVSRNAPCPCGRRIRFRKCHRNAVADFRRDAEPNNVLLVTEWLKERYPPTMAALRAQLRRRTR